MALPCKCKEPKTNGGFIPTCDKCGRVVCVTENKEDNENIKRSN